MGDNHTTGVVNDQGQVYNAQGGLHAGLYVADAAVIPTSLGVNPFMTISALAERRAEHLVTTLGGTPAVITRIPPT
jgi:cholesterol oxidase